MPDDEKKVTPKKPTKPVGKPTVGKKATPPAKTAKKTPVKKPTPKTARPKTKKDIEGEFECKETEAADAVLHLKALGVMPNLCTSGDIADSQDVLARLRRGEFPLQHYSAYASSNSSDPAQIAVLRARCPKRDGEPEMDLEVARALLEDASLYDSALGTPPETAGVHQEAQSQNGKAACHTDRSDPLMLPGSC